jgi:hypothetical protein
MGHGNFASKIQRRDILRHLWEQSVGRAARQLGLWNGFTARHHRFLCRFSGHSFAGRELRVSLISDAAILSEIVPGLIARNAAQFANERIEFRKVDIVIDPLPEGDLCIIRQVFQHPLEQRYLHRPRESETVSSVGRHG